MKEINNFLSIKLLIIIIPLIIGFIVGSLSKPDEWYFKLNKPKLTPPSYVFGIAWSILYILIGISYYLALKDRSVGHWIIPIIHLILNYAYTPLIFIYKRLLESAIITLLVLITAIIVMILFYSYGNMISVLLLIPYIIWLIFANYLAWSVYSLNT
jgi:tryptophan-rich sensory protein